VPYPGGPPGDVDAYILPSVFPGCFANGLPAKEAALLPGTQRPLAVSALSEPSGPPAWKTVPWWAVIGTADNVIPPAELRFMAKRADAHITDVKAGHLSMISKPAAVTRVIVAAANSSS
jgi:pimeloyl-ACP methyl ester carboxylesterase